MRWSFALLALTGLLSRATTGSAEIDLARAFSNFARENPEGKLELPRLLANRAGRSVSLLAERVDPKAPWPVGATPLSESFCTLELSLADATEVSSRNPGFRFDWSRGRRLLLDRADGWIRASNARSASGLTGTRAIIGIVDSGVDVTHPDLRQADGSTRVRWLVDFGRPPLGRHPDLEEELGCGGAVECGVYDAADIDELLANGISGDEPRDTVGHGTLVASLAAGSGASSSPARYVGVAPDAELIVARVTASGLAINDADIVNATRFVFERADELGRPAVVNLSLGSDFGAHDGSSALERALASLIGDAHPGRALVVAAGNSAGLYVDPARPSSPLGIHTEFHLPRHTTLRLPLLTPVRPAGAAGIDVWIETRQDDDVSIAVELDGRTIVGPVARGASHLAREASFEVAVKNADPNAAFSKRWSANVLIGGTWPDDSTFVLRLAGRGSVAIWLQGSDALDPALGPGPMLEGGLKTGTINVPAAHPSLIAVGASLNRTDWIDVAGREISMPRHGALDDAPLDTTAFFSSAGPNSLGTMKPDLTAPGVHLIGALSRQADPRTGSGNGMFAADDRCPAGDQCYVADEGHGVASGSSLAAPLVSGAIALMFEANPGLTQSAVRALLQAGARPLEGVIFSEQQVGIGALDIEGTLTALQATSAANERVPAAASSWLVPAAPYINPDPQAPIEFHAELRDEAGKLADGFDSRRLVLVARGGSIAEPLQRLAPGLYRFALVAPTGSGGSDVTVQLEFDDRLLLTRTLPIAVDPHVESHPVSARGGCGLQPGQGRSGNQTPAPIAGVVGLSGLALAALVRLRRRRTRSH